MAKLAAISIAIFWILILLDIRKEVRRMKQHPRPEDELDETEIFWHK